MALFSEPHGVTCLAESSFGYQKSRAQYQRGAERSLSPQRLVEDRVRVSPLSARIPDRREPHLGVALLGLVRPQIFEQHFRLFEASLEHVEVGKRKTIGG